VGRMGATEGRLADASPAKGAVLASSKSRPEASALRSVVVYDGVLDIGEELPVGATGVRWAGSLAAAGIAFLCSLTRLGRKMMRPATCLVGVLWLRNASSMSASLVELAYMVTPDAMTVPSDSRKAESTGSILHMVQTRMNNLMNKDWGDPSIGCLASCRMFHLIAVTAFDAERSAAWLSKSAIAEAMVTLTSVQLC